MPSQACEQIHYVSASVSLCSIRLLSEQLHQAHQLPLKLLLISEVGHEPTENRLHEQAYLTIADIVFALRFHKRVGEEQRRASTDNLVAHLLHQPFAHILQHHLLEGKDGSLLCSLDQAAPPQ